MKILSIEGDGLGERFACFRNFPGEVINNPLIEMVNSLDIALLIEKSSFDILPQVALGQVCQPERFPKIKLVKGK